MKKLGKLSFAAVAASALVMFSCNSGSQNNAAESNTAAATATATNSDIKIAYVEVDSIMTQYEFCKQSKVILEKKQQNIQSTLTKKQQALQSAAVKFEQDVRANKYTQQQAEGVQANLQKQSYDMQMLEGNLLKSYQEEENKFNIALQDSIKNFIREYNKDKKYTYILTKMGDNILYGAPECDITAEVIKGLNKAYKPNKK